MLSLFRFEEMYTSNVHINMHTCKCTNLTYQCVYDFSLQLQKILDIRYLPDNNDVINKNSDISDSN